MRKMHIICPICSKSRRIQIPQEIFEIDESSLLKYPIEKGTICPHQFLIVLDYFFSIRDYEIPKSDEEFQKYLAKINFPEISPDFAYF
jgi:hypothetical protein